MAFLLSRPDLCIVIVYLIATLIIGWMVASGSRDVEGYTVGNRSLGGIVIGFSVLGTFLSSITFLGLPADTFKQNWSAFIFGAALPLAALIAVVYFIPLYRTHTKLSAFELLEQRFGYWARLYANLSYQLLQLIRIGMVLLLVAFAVEPMMNLDGPPSVTANVEAVPPGDEPLAAESKNPSATTAAPSQLDLPKLVVILAVVGGLVIVYDTVGGIRAVIWTDVMQVFVLTFGALWCLWTLVSAVGGFGEFFRQVPAERFSLGPWLNWNESGAWDWSIGSVLVIFLYGLTENLRNYGADQNYVQRMLCARSDRAATTSIWFGALTYVPLSVVFCLIGTALWMYYGQPGHVLPENIKPDQVFPHFIQTGLPKPIAGMVIAGILAAAMSTIDSCLNSCSTVAFVDVVRRLGLRPKWLSEIVMLRAITVTLGVLGTGFAVLLLLVYAEESQALMRLWWQYAGTAGGGLFGLFLLAWLMPRVPAWGAALGVLATFPVLAWGTFARKLPEEWSGWECPLHPNLVGISGTATMLAIGGLLLLGVKLGLLTPNRRVDIAGK